jgi:hypothetical protein
MWIFFCLRFPIQLTAWIWFLDQSVCRYMFVGLEKHREKLWKESLMIAYELNYTFGGKKSATHWNRFLIVSCVSCECVFVCRWKYISALYNFLLNWYLFFCVKVVSNSIFLCFLSWFFMSFIFFSGYKSFTTICLLPVSCCWILSRLHPSFFVNIV